MAPPSKKQKTSPSQETVKRGSDVEQGKKETECEMIYRRKVLANLEDLLTAHLADLKYLLTAHNAGRLVVPETESDSANMTEALKALIEELDRSSPLAPSKVLVEIAEALIALLKRSRRQRVANILSAGT